MTHRLQLTSPVSARAGWFGYSVAIDGTRMPIGVPVGGTGNCGSACEYMSSGGTWVTREQLSSPGCTFGCRFGAAVALSGQTGLIGAPNDEFTAAAYVVGLV